MFYHSTPILSQRRFSEGIIRVLYEDKVAAKWMLHLIKALCPQLIRHPVFSRCTIRNLDPNSLSLVTSQSKKLTDKLISMGKKIGLDKCGLVIRIYWMFMRKDEKAAEEAGNEPYLISDLKKLIASHPLYDNIGYDVYSKEYQFKTSPQYIELLLTMMELEQIEISRVN